MITGFTNHEDAVLKTISGLPRREDCNVTRLANMGFTDFAPKIAISGKMGSGKTTLAKALSLALGAPVVSFADPLKAGCKALGIRVDEKNKDRVALQEIANFLVARDPTHFVKLFDTKTRRSREQYGAIVPDMRLPQEWVWAKVNGFLLVRLDIQPETQIARGRQPDRLDHWTETGLDFIPPESWDVYLPEADGIYAADMESRVAAVLAALKARQ